MIELFYLMIPAYIANMAPVFARRVKWDLPMDFGKTLFGKRIFGDHKTWKGLIVGIIAGTVAGVLISQIYWPIAFSPLLWSLLASTGALLGDAAKSFFKRQFGIPSGKSWTPFDQIDYSVGALLLGSIIYHPGILSALIVIIASAIGHIAVNHIAYYIGIRGEKW